MIKLGTKVKDSITGCVGIAVRRLEYLDGRVEYGLRIEVGNDNKIASPQFVEESQIKEEEDHADQVGFSTPPSAPSTPEFAEHEGPKLGRTISREEYRKHFPPEPEPDQPKPNDPEVFDPEGDYWLVRPNGERYVQRPGQPVTRDASRYMKREEAFEVDAVVRWSSSDGRQMVQGVIKKICHQECADADLAYIDAGGDHILIGLRLLTLIEPAPEARA